MRKTLAIIRRELVAYFSSPLAYIVLTAFLLMQGYIFYVIVSFLNNPSTQARGRITSNCYLLIEINLFLLFTVPVITMRLIAEERRSGPIEVLLPSPVSEGQVIAAKFIAALIFYVVLWLPTFLYVVVLARHSTIDLMPVAAGYIGVLLVGFLFLAVGTFTSTLTDNQLIAAITAFALLIVLFSIGLVEQLLVSSSMLRDAVGYMNLWTHMDDYAKGIVDSRHVVYELSVGLLFLFLATKSLEVKKWR